jgi:hypothetical protein
MPAELICVFLCSLLSTYGGTAEVILAPKELGHCIIPLWNCHLYSYNSFRW